VKVLSVRQPWAALIAQGVKRIENRTWSTTYRGPLLIHAGRTIDTRAAQILAAHGVQLPELVTGAIVARVQLVDCVRYEDLEPELAADPFAEPGGWCWVLAEAQALEPVACAGRLGLWTLPDNVAVPRRPAR